MAEKQESSVTDSVQKLFVEAKPGAGEVADAAEHAVYTVLAELARGGEVTGEAIGAAASGIVGGVKKAVCPTWHASRGALVGVIHATGGAGGDVPEAIRTATSTLVRETAAMDGDFGAVAKGAVQGCIQGAEERGLDIDECAHVAAGAALQAAEGLRPSAVVKVRHAVGGSVDGIPTGL